METQSEQAVQKSAKQKLFEAATKFRINTERVTPMRWQYQPASGRIVLVSTNQEYDVLEINAYSVKIRANILGSTEAVWCRFESFIFDNN